MKINESPRKSMTTHEKHRKSEFDENQYEIEQLLNKKKNI